MAPYLVVLHVLHIWHKRLPVHDGLCDGSRVSGSAATSRRRRSSFKGNGRRRGQLTPSHTEASAQRRAHCGQRVQYRQIGLLQNPGSLHLLDWHQALQTPKNGKRIRYDSCKAALSHSDHVYQSDAEIREAFALFDKRGAGAIPRESLGDLLRALGQNPTQAEVAELASQHSRDSEYRCGWTCGRMH